MSMIETRADGETAFKNMGAAGLFNKGNAKGIDIRFNGVRRQADLGRSAFHKGKMGSGPSAQASDTDSAQQEFLKSRDRLASISRKNPTARLAAFLVALVHLNSDEGSGALVISETTDARFVADFLSLSFDELTRLLLQFKSDGLVAPLPNGAMRITNLAGLERLADGHSLPKYAPAVGSLPEEQRMIVEPPRVYARFAAASAPLSDYDNAIRFHVFSLTSAACLVIAFGIAYGIVGL